VSEDILIRRVSRVEARCEPMEWTWARENRSLIEANWQRRKAQTPKMFNGRVLLLSHLDFERDLCRNIYFETNYDGLLAWLDSGYPDRTIANGFAMGALRGTDGAFICGVMSAHTANAGRVYFAGGTPDRSDLRPDGSVDLATSLTRELIEETGLQENEFQVDDEWIVVRRWPTVAFLRMVTLPMTAQEGADLIRANIAREEEPELQDVQIIRGVEDIDREAMPLFQQSFFEWVFSQR